MATNPNNYLNFKKDIVNDSDSQLFIAEMSAALVNWIERGLHSSKPQVVNTALIATSRLSGFLGEREGEIKSIAIKKVGEMANSFHPSDWRSRRAAWDVCCGVVNGTPEPNGDPGGCDIYDGLTPADHGTDRPESRW